MANKNTKNQMAFNSSIPVGSIKSGPKTEINKAPTYQLPQRRVTAAKMTPQMVMNWQN